MYGIVATLQTASLVRVYAVYRGVFIMHALVWARKVNRVKQDRYDIIGSVIALLSAEMIYDTQ
ncbi:hypothetical protein KHS38_20790 [Mucilaginibacter sp. Bleaf8]|nr:hypothetical protein [Mucilaginibacter sp. Bleaf8]